MYAVGVKNASKKELLDYTLGDEGRVVSLDDFNELQQTVEQLVKTISTLQVEGSYNFDC